MEDALPEFVGVSSFKESPGRERARDYIDQDLAPRLRAAVEQALAGTGFTKQRDDASPDLPLVLGWDQKLPGSLRMSVEWRGERLVENAFTEFDDGDLDTNPLEALRQHPEGRAAIEKLERTYNALRQLAQAWIKLVPRPSPTIDIDPNSGMTGDIRLREFDGGNVYFSFDASPRAGHFTCPRCQHRRDVSDEELAGGRWITCMECDRVVFTDDKMQGWPDGLHKLDPEKDVEALQQLVHLAKHDGADSFRFGNTWAEDGEGQAWAIAQDGRLVAYALWNQAYYAAHDDDLWVLRQLYTRRDYRRRGLASRLVKIVAEPLAAFAVETPVSETRALLEKLGYLTTKTVYNRSA